MRPGNPEALSQPYDPVRLEPARYRFWEEHGVFQPRETGKAPFVIAIPPPNVTGSLTMGHVLGESIRDCVIRWQRMEGRETLYIPGMDHAGIATQNVVDCLRKDFPLSSPREYPTMALPIRSRMALFPPPHLVC